MSILREVIARLGVDFDSKPLDDGNRKIDGSIGALKALGTALASSAVVVGISSFANSFSEAGSAIQDASDRLGVATDDLQELQFAFGQAGVRGEQVNAALTGLSQRLEQAHAGTGPAAGAFRALGVSITDAAGQVRPASDVMDDIATRMGAIENPARRVQLATQLFGNAGRRLTGVLHDGSGGLAEMRQQFQALGGGMSEDGVHAADEYGDALGRLNVSWLSMKTRVAVVLLPVLEKVIDIASKLGAGFSALTRNTHLVEGAFIAGGVALAVRYAPAIRSAVMALRSLSAASLLSVAGVILLALTVDDLIALFRGGPSVIEDVVDSMSHIGATQQIVQSLRESWQDLINTINEAHEIMGFDGSNVHGRTSAPGTRAAHVDGPVRGEGRTSAAGARTAGKVVDPVVAAQTARQDAAFAAFNGQQAITATHAVSATAPHSVTTAVVDRSQHLINVTVKGHAGESDDAFARRVAVAIQRAQESHADANHPLPQRSE